MKRTFSFIAGISLVEYIKNRRLALANAELIKGASVTEISFKYRYQTVEGFPELFENGRVICRQKSLKTTNKNRFLNAHFT